MSTDDDHWPKRLYRRLVEMFVVGYNLQMTFTSLVEIFPKAHLATRTIMAFHRIPVLQYSCLNRTALNSPLQ